MPECPVCRREFDARFEVFAGPSGQSYDTVECARRAASSAGDQEIFPPALLPTIELLPLVRPTAAAPLVTSRRRLAAAFAIPFVASPAAVAAGLSLVAVGTATSLALWFPSLDGNGKPVITAAAAAPTHHPRWQSRLRPGRPSRVTQGPESSRRRAALGQRIRAHPRATGSSPSPSRTRPSTLRSVATPISATRNRHSRSRARLLLRTHHRLRRRRPLPHRYRSPRASL